MNTVLHFLPPKLGGWGGLLLLLTLCAAAHGQAASLYADNITRPLRVHVVSRQTLPQCRLERFSYEGANGLRVPALLFLPRTASKAYPVPCLLALHGYGGGKETLAGWAFYAAGAGYATLAIDLWGQGERQQVQTSTVATVAQVQHDLVTGVPQTVKDARRGLDYLRTRPEINSKRLGLLGFSLGAMIGTVTAGVDTRLKAVVLVSGGGDWPLILRSLSGRAYQNRTVADARSVDWDKLAVTLAPEDPLSFAGRIAPRPVLMVNGRQDMTIFPVAAERLYDAARAAPGSRVQIRWLPTGGHIPDTDIVYPLVRDWLKKTL